MSQATLVRARAGDESAFAELMAPLLPQLRLYCYRLLGSLGDAEDALQETLVAAWRGLDGYEERASLRSWLYTIATNRCHNARRDRGRRPVPVPPFTPPAPTDQHEVPWLEPYPDALLAGVPPVPEARYDVRESVELAFIEALQRLPPRQAAVLVLRDVLGFAPAEVAGMLATTQVAVKGALARARSTMERRLDRAALGSASSGSASSGSAADRALAQRFAAAFMADDIDGVVALLTDDAWLAMPPAPHRYRGPAAIAGFLRASAAARAGRHFVLTPTGMNRQPAFSCTLDGAPAGVIVLALAGPRVRALTRFLPAPGASTAVVP